MLDRALAALCARYRAVCHVDELPWGMVLQWKYDYNLIVVRGEQPELGIDELAASADGLQWFLPEQGIEIHDERLAARLGPQLQAQGWELDRLLVLARPTAGAASPAGVEELPLDRYRDLRVAAVRERPWGGSDGAVAHVLATDAALAEVLAVKAYAVCIDGRPVAAARCYDWPEQDVGEVDDVFTLPGHRRRGYGAAAVLAAVAASGRAGRDGCWVLVDDGSDAVRFYERLGFAPLGAIHDYRLRRPGEPEDGGASPA